MEFTINFSAINLLVVFGATVAANLLGGIWYSPAVFGKVWRAAAGLPYAGDGMKNPSMTFVSGFILLLIVASMLAALLGPGAGALEGIQLGSLLGFSFVLTTYAVTNLFERRPFSLILINSGYHVASMTLMGYIIGSFG